MVGNDHTGNAYCGFMMDLAIKGGAVEADVAVAGGRRGVQDWAGLLVECAGAEGVGPTGGEGAKQWAAMLGQLRNRGLADALVVCCDGLGGLPESIRATWPEATVQTCVAHMARGRGIQRHRGAEERVGLGARRAIGWSRDEGRLWAGQFVAQKKRDPVRSGIPSPRYVGCIRLAPTSRTGRHWQL